MRIIPAYPGAGIDSGGRIPLKSISKVSARNCGGWQSLSRRCALVRSAASGHILRIGPGFNFLVAGLDAGGRIPAKYISKARAFSSNGGGHFQFSNLIRIFQNGISKGGPRSRTR